MFEAHLYDGIRKKMNPIASGRAQWEVDGYC